MFTRCECAKFAVYEWNQFFCEVISVVADCRRVDVLVASQGREAIGKHQNSWPHLALEDQAGRTLGNIFLEITPVDVAKA